MFPALRVIAVLHALSLLMQPILAGLFLSGQDTAVDMHLTNAMVVVALCLVQTVLAALLWRNRTVVRRIFTQSLALLVLEVVEMGGGFGHTMWLHIPLGTALVAGVATLMPQIMGAQSVVWATETSNETSPALATADAASAGAEAAE
jgi:hypothetical protein